MRREGRMPTTKEDVCSACESLEGCEQHSDTILECAHAVIHELVAPKKMKQFIVKCFQFLQVGDGSKLRTMDIGVGSRCRRTGIIAIKLDAIPVNGEMELWEEE